MPHYQSAHCSQSLRVYSYLRGGSFAYSMAGSSIFLFSSLSKHFCAATKVHNMKLAPDLRFNCSDRSSLGIYFSLDPLDFPKFQIYSIWSSATRPKMSGHSLKKPRSGVPKLVESLTFLDRCENKVHIHDVWQKRAHTS